MEKIDRYMTISSAEECLREWEALDLDPRCFIKKKNDTSHFFQGRHVGMTIVYAYSKTTTSEALREIHAHGASKQVDE